jgi:hypothetical protein
MNVVALLFGGLILLLTAVAKAYQLVVLLPVLVLVVGYWRLRAHPQVTAVYFGLSLALLGWIVICENIVTLDNIFNSQISSHPQLDFRLQSYVETNLHTRARRYLEPCCNDPLTWHYRPGSLYRATFDCPTCNEPYEVQVDETGYLNRQRDLFQSQQQIALFLAGDSVLQGIGMPSVLEWVRAQIPLHMWNLSIQAYGPRQKINALITYALPKQPRWLIVEFYAGNDLLEEVRNDICESMGDFRCRYNNHTLTRLIARHPVYRTIFDVGERPSSFFEAFKDASTHNLTLATTRYVVGTLKAALRERLGTETAPAAQRHDEMMRTGPPFQVRQGQWLAYLQNGLGLAQKSYEVLVAKLEGMEHRPTVILLYHPTPYEVYRDMRYNLGPKTGQSSAFMREGLGSFAHGHGWRFLDLTEPLRQEVLPRNIWLYGQYDKTHLSPQGTPVFAAVLARELAKIMELR